MAKVPATSPKIIRRKQLEEILGLSRSAIYAKMTLNPKRPREYDPTFPRPIRIGLKAVGWVESEIDRWIVNQIEIRKKIEQSIDRSVRLAKGEFYRASTLKTHKQGATEESREFKHAKATKVTGEGKR